LSEPKFTKGDLEEKDVIRFVQKPCSPGYHSEVRVMSVFSFGILHNYETKVLLHYVSLQLTANSFTPEREVLPGANDRGPWSREKFQSWPFTYETYNSLIESCGFFKVMTAEVQGGHLENNSQWSNMQVS